MRVGGKRGGGAVRGPGQAKGPSGSEKVKGPAFAGRVDRNAGVEAVSAGATSNVPASPVVREALAIVKALQEGKIPDKGAATSRLVESILKEKFGGKLAGKKKIAKAIADTIGEDPHLASLLERIWSKRESA
jgi:hypothetical protein